MNLLSQISCQAGRASSGSSTQSRRGTRHSSVAITRSGEQPRRIFTLFIDIPTLHCFPACTDYVNLPGLAGKQCNVGKGTSRFGKKASAIAIHCWPDSVFVSYQYWKLLTSIFEQSFSQTVSSNILQGTVTEVEIIQRLLVDKHLFCSTDGCKSQFSTRAFNVMKIENCFKNI